MASAISVKLGGLVSPQPPDKAADADIADPGEVEKLKLQQRESGKGKYGSTKVDEASTETAEESQATSEELTWIEIELRDEEGKPLPGEVYKVVTSDNRSRTGTLDDKGLARVEGIKKGNCNVSFPNLDKQAWRRL